MTRTWWDRHEINLVGINADPQMHQYYRWGAFRSASMPTLQMHQYYRCGRVPVGINADPTDASA
ncbi:hypothetical protein [Pantoea dispersa]|uniref:hypothetical protein n=1 Tax=Pantoea dispersa TaxID=59814 RepID=UPI0021C8182E|nr:hypothetical protein [Pantoea dispersa]UXO69290.1 hypothetical protein N7977_04525 [Pantoea dispersa]